MVPYFSGCSTPSVTGLTVILRSPIQNHMKAFRDVLVIPAAFISWIICDWILSYALAWYVELSLGWSIVALLTIGLVSALFVAVTSLWPMTIASSRGWGAWGTAGIIVMLRLSIILFMIGDPRSPVTFIIASVLACLITIGVAIMRMRSTTSGVSGSVGTGSSDGQ